MIPSAFFSTFCFWYNFCISQLVYQLCFFNSYDKPFLQLFYFMEFALVAELNECDYNVVSDMLDS